MEAQDNHTDFTRTETGSGSLPMKGLSFHTCLNRLSYMVALPITAQVPLVADPCGTLRVQRTRVTLDSIVKAFRVGTTAEEIAQKFPSVSLADVYLIISHYLHHAAKIDSYLSGQRAEAAALQQSTEQRFDPTGLRARLLARRASQSPP
jgi:uncharacterized protein (DUF433 family)